MILLQQHKEQVNYYLKYIEEKKVLDHREIINHNIASEKVYYLLSIFLSHIISLLSARCVHIVTGSLVTIEQFTPYCPLDYLFIENDLRAFSFHS